MSIMIILPVSTQRQKIQQPRQWLQYPDLARRWHFGFREEPGMRENYRSGLKRKEIHTLTLMHHSSKVDIHSILNVDIKSVQRQYCVWSTI